MESDNHPARSRDRRRTASGAGSSLSPLRGEADGWDETGRVAWAGQGETDGGKTGVTSGARPAAGWETDAPQP